ncbi:uncharacterized protein LOC131927245 [Physella acuta]|uniref:uncharacterized protein LOC131927245 n=1 Tax=Physella acuta TaxID=109671 RepID=UPI0027DDB386|nr:uncharacterized protein LOC131927245 [Physella acuta]
MSIDEPIYFNIDCGLTYPIQDDSARNLTFFLKVSMDFNKTVDSNQVSIFLNAPKPTLSDKCFSVREDNVFWPNETIHCTCEMRDIDNSTIDVTWYYADHPERFFHMETVPIVYEDGKDTRFLCQVTSHSGKVYNIIYVPNFADAAKVTLFTANGERDINVVNGTVVEFNCEVDSKPRGTVYITDSSGQRLDGTSKLLTCDDTGTYTCQAFNEIFPNQISRQYVHVTVPCDHWLEQIITTGSNIQRIYAGTGENFSIYFELSMGNTTITKYEINKNGWNKPILMYKDKDENAASGRYLIQFRPLTETHNKITLTIFNIESVDFGTYTLKIYDNNADVVEAKLQIIGNTTVDDGYEIGMFTVLAVLILSIVVNVMCFCRMYRRKKRRKKDQVVPIQEHFSTATEESELLQHSVVPHRDIKETAATVRKSTSSFNEGSTSGHQDMHNNAQTIPKVPYSSNRGNVSSVAYQERQDLLSINPINPSSSFT